MKQIILEAKMGKGLGIDEIKDVIKESLNLYGASLKRVLLIPPDLSRMHSGGGEITAMYYEFLRDICHVDVLPALGTHMPITLDEKDLFFGSSIPFERFIKHNWREDVVKIGEVPSMFVKEVSEGICDYAIDVEINRIIVEGNYDLILSIGQVVPHEVVGMANYSKNIFVGCGGKSIIDKSHMLGAVYGMEKLIGKDHSPVRKVFDYAEDKFLNSLPIKYLFTVTTCMEEKVVIHGIFIGRGRELFEKAVAMSQQKNITFLDKPVKKIVAWLDPNEFKSTWIGNKAVYRTRMAIEDGGELIVLAPGVRQCGEDMGNDALIRKYGYKGREYVLKAYETNQDLRQNSSVAAHLIHGSSDDRFRITYAVKHLSQDETESIGYRYLDFDEALKLYDPKKLKEGFNRLENGEEVFFVPNPAIGLWAFKDRF